MFGTLRYFFAFFVAATHLSAISFYGPVAVFGFFVLSGYLMTRVCHETYRGSLRCYAANRALRLYPPYLVVVLFSLAAYSLIDGPWLLSGMILPDDPGTWFSNVTLIGLTALTDSRVIPVAWSLFVEICYYAAIPFFARTRAMTLLWLAASLVYTVYIFDAPFLDRYYAVPAGSLPFSLGAAIYHFAPRLKRPGRHVAAAVLFLTVVLVTSLAVPIEVSLRGHFYLSMPFTAYLVMALSQVEVNQAVRRLDTFFGEIAYPVFLCHSVVGSLIAIAFDLTRSGLLFLVSMPIVVIVSIAIHHLVEKPIMPLRDLLRHRAAAAAALPNDRSWLQAAVRSRIRSRPPSPSKPTL